jgi:4-hydroxybenzoyl-CoA thioesterase
MIPVDWTSLVEPTFVSTRGSGHVAALRNSRTVRIEWGDCDPAGIVFYPRYFQIFDACTAVLFERALGVSKYRQLKIYDFAGYPLVRTRARFLRPTRYGDQVAVDSGISFGRSSFEVEHSLSLAGQTCVECSEKRVWVVRDSATGGFKSHPLPAAVLAMFGAAASSDSPAG